MMKQKMLLVVLAVAFLFGATAYAHHSFSAVYNVKDSIKLEGNLVQFVLRNPHSFVFIEAPDQEGKTQRWSLEWGGAAQLAGQGVQQKTLNVGDHVIVTGQPSRAPGEYRVLLKTLKRPSDGYTWGTKGETFD
jgi:Family of unknown function (DUF6152)